MFRVRKISVLCLAAVLFFSQTAWAAVKGAKSKVKIDGTKVLVRVMEESNIQISQSAYLKDADNKVILRWKLRPPQKSFRGKDDRLYNYYFYNIDMYRYAPGKYTLCTESIDRRLSIPFNYPGSTVLSYKSSKVIRNNNGDVVQRFYFTRNNTGGKMIHVQIFDGEDKLVYSHRTKSANSNQLYSFTWDGWPSGNSAKRCPRGVYTIKYWADGTSPRVKKFKLAI